MAPLLFHERLTEAWFCFQAIAASSFLSTTNPASRLHAKLFRHLNKANR